MAEFAGRRSAHKRVLALTSEEAGFYIVIVKWRNQLLALFCLFLFLAFGVFYFRYWVIQKPFGIILFIGEGLDAQTLAAARLHAGGADKLLALDSLPYTAVLKNHSADSSVPDAAAAATAMATGRKVKNGAVAVDADGRKLTALLELAREMGRVTGLITDGDLTAPTAASFYGHAAQGDQWELFARQLIETNEIDIVLGGGAGDFLPQAQGGRRTDDKDLTRAARDAGYTFVQSLAELDAVPRWPSAKLFGFFRGTEFGAPDETRTPRDQPTLSEMVRRGIELLQFHRGGYLLVVDATSIRRASQQGQREQRLAAAVEFDRAIAVASEYTGEKSAIFVCSDVADDVEYFRAKAKAATPRPPEPVPVPSWRIYPNVCEPLDGATPFPWQSEVAPDLEGETPPAALSSTDRLTPLKPDHIETAEDVLAFGKGLGAEALHGTRENTAVFEVIRDNL